MLGKGPDDFRGAGEAWRPSCVLGDALMVDLRRQAAESVRVGWKTMAKLYPRALPHWQCARALAARSAVRPTKVLGAGE